MAASTDAILDQYHIRMVPFQDNTLLTRHLLATGNRLTVYENGRPIALRRRSEPAVSAGAEPLSPALVFQSGGGNGRRQNL